MPKMQIKSVKEEIIEMIQRLPDDCTLERVLYHLHVRRLVEEGMKDVEAGRTYSQEEVERMAAERLKSSGRKRP